MVHSGTKYLCGHNDILAGFLTVKDDPQLIADIELYVKSTGANLSAQDAWLMLRSLKTLGIRMERQQENAQRIAHWLCQQDIVTHVYYVGLPDHPGYELNRQRCHDFLQGSPARNGQNYSGSGKGNFLCRKPGGR